MDDGVKELTERMNVLVENVGHALGIMSKQVDDLTQKVELLSETEDLQPTCNQLATDNINRQAAKTSSADRPIGHWIDIDTQAYTWKVRCNKCGHERSMMSTQGVYPNFCENCGADMRGKQDE